MITQDDIDAVRVQISRISDLNSVLVAQTSNSKTIRTNPAIEQTAYALSRMLDLIETLSQQVPPTSCQTDTSPHSSNPPSST